jgi:hypothetical protein
MCGGPALRDQMLTLALQIIGDFLLVALLPPMLILTAGSAAVAVYEGARTAAIWAVYALLMIAIATVIAYGSTLAIWGCVAVFTGALFWETRQESEQVSGSASQQQHLNRISAHF